MDEVPIIIINITELVKIVNYLNRLFISCDIVKHIHDWGISLNGRAPALHAGGTGIDT